MSSFPVPIENLEAEVLPEVLPELVDPSSSSSEELLSTSSSVSLNLSAFQSTSSLEANLARTGSFSSIQDLPRDDLYQGGSPPIDEEGEASSNISSEVPTATTPLDDDVSAASAIMDDFEVPICSASVDDKDTTGNATMEDIDEPTASTSTDVREDSTPSTSAMFKTPVSPTKELKVLNISESSEDSHSDSNVQGTFSPRRLRTRRNDPELNDLLNSPYHTRRKTKYVLGKERDDRSRGEGGSKE